MTEDDKRFYQALDFLRRIREYFDRIGVNYIDDFRNIEMWVRRGYYGKNK